MANIYLKEELGCHDPPCISTLRADLTIPIGSKNRLVILGQVASTNGNSEFMGEPMKSVRM